VKQREVGVSTAALWGDRRAEVDRLMGMAGDEVAGYRQP